MSSGWSAAMLCYWRVKASIAHSLSGWKCGWHVKHHTISSALLCFTLVNFQSRQHLTKTPSYSSILTTASQHNFMQQQPSPPSYGHYTSQPALTDTSSWELEDFVGTKFYCPHALATSVFGLGRRCWSSPQQCYLHCLCTTTRCRWSYHADDRPLPVTSTQFSQIHSNEIQTRQNKPLTR